MHQEKIVPDLSLEFCSSTQVRLFEERHYVEKMPSVNDLPALEYERVNETPEKRAAFEAKLGKPRGHHGQQIHFLIWYKGEHVGVISGGSAVFGTRSRDAFFGITRDNKTQTLNGVIDNTLFRLEKHERNLATRCVALWRKTVVGYWQYLYDVVPYGFETYVLDRPIAERPGKTRSGALYLADNWTFTGTSFGSTKNHIGVGLTGSKKLGGKGSFARVKVTPKLEFCKWREGFSEAVYSEYKSSWKAGTKVGTPEEKALAKERIRRRQACMGTHSMAEVAQ